ncbi:hypothetical protein Pint_27563 [Pistacia integerrima]|uniref:Uncharacterized protein n=1 Tax=Pistacia integerrima TaxID=434235 RepID=A0ACC0YT44_9ROSI|nr:hypothetical protein Pint_27563 [Pistacia integerrima]
MGRGLVFTLDYFVDALSNSSQMFNILNREAVVYKAWWCQYRLFLFSTYFPVTFYCNGKGLGFPVQIVHMSSLFNVCCLISRSTLGLSDYPIGELEVQEEPSFLICKDLIFLIYLYQRWVYPVDRSRVNEFGFGGEDDKPSDGLETDVTVRKEEEKKTN